MPKAVWNNTVIAESDATELVEGNHYFPPEAVNMDALTLTEQHTTCPWKGQASYYTISANGEQLVNAAWTYLTPKDAASNITKHVAFDRRVTVS
ncbi:MAG: DUF427 domain-containing protein [Deinococcota bacterium]